MEKKTKNRILMGTAYASLLAGGYLLISPFFSPSFRIPPSSPSFLEEKSLIQSKNYWVAVKNTIEGLENEYVRNSKKNPEFYIGLKNLERLCAVESEVLDTKLKNLSVDETLAQEKQIAQIKSNQALKSVAIGGGLCALAMILTSIYSSSKERGKK